MKRISKTAVATVALLGFLTGCGSDDPANERTAGSGADSGFTPPPLTTEESEDPSAPVAQTQISYDGRLSSRPAGPGSSSRQPMGIACESEVGECTVLGLSVGNQPVLTLARQDADSFTVDLPATPSTCEERGASAVTGAIELSGRSITMELEVGGETVPCPDGDILYEPGSYRFVGEYVDGGLPGFSVE